MVLAAGGHDRFLVTSGGQYALNDQIAARGESLTSSNVGLRRMTSERDNQSNTRYSHHQPPRSSRDVSISPSPPSMTRDSHNVMKDFDNRSSSRMDHSDHWRNSIHNRQESNASNSTNNRSRHFRHETQYTESPENKPQMQQLDPNQQQLFNADVSSHSVIAPRAHQSVNTSGKLQDSDAKQGI